MFSSLKNVTNKTLDKARGKKGQNREWWTEKKVEWREKDTAEGIGDLCFRMGQLSFSLPSIMESSVDILWPTELVTAGLVHLAQLSFPLT